MDTTATTQLEPVPSRSELERQIEDHRHELTGYCYRMLGSAFEADDAVQETMLRSWRALDRFEGRSSLRSWLYRIATNVCLDMLQGKKRRALPMDMTEPSAGDKAPAAPLPEATWLEPMPTSRVVPKDVDPAEQAVAEESIRLAFVAALQHLPARQRAVLILREVLRWQASEVAELLDTTVVSVNSALQRARATLASSGVSGDEPAAVDEEQQALLARYVDAFQRYDIAALVALLREDVVLSMPPFELWMQGVEAMQRWFNGEGIGCKGSKLVPVDVNGVPGFAQYRRAASGDGYEAFSIHVPRLDGDRIAGLDFFVDERLFALFDLPVRLDA